MQSMFSGHHKMNVLLTYQIQGLRNNFNVCWSGGQNLCYEYRIFCGKIINQPSHCYDCCDPAQYTIISI